MSATRSTWLGPPPQLPATRVVSLVPSLTHAVCRLGAGSRLAARTEFCVRPTSIADLETVGGTKNCDVARILEIEPDVVLANREENTRRRIERLAEKLPVLVTDIASPHEVPALWRELGQICGREEAAEHRASEVVAELAACGRNAGGPAPSFVYWIWRDPWMAVGHDTYISALLTAAGWRNALPPEATRYPKIEPGALPPLDGVTMLFSSEPYAFELPRDLDAFPSSTDAGDGWWQLQEGGAAVEVDGQLMSWYPSLTADGLRVATGIRALHSAKVRLH
jgi:ABC-type Fe3+-hydroxamate transport system substrate-binding protein